MTIGQPGELPGSKAASLKRSFGTVILFIFAVAIVFVVASVVLPVLRRHSLPSLQYRADVINRTDDPLIMFVVDATADETRSVRLPARGAGVIHLAVGEGSEEVWGRTIQLLVLSTSGVEHTHAAFTGHDAAHIDSIEIGPASVIKYRKHDKSAYTLGDKSP